MITSFVVHFLCCILFVQAIPSPPVWPQQYSAAGIFSIPYGYGITEPIMCYYDAIHNRVKLDYWDGMDTYYYRYDLNYTYMVIPRIQEQTCFPSTVDSPPDSLPTMLPDITEWSYTGTGKLANKDVLFFQKNVTNLGHTSVYTMAVTADEQPVRLTMEGYDFLFGSHPDLYVLDYLEYVPYVDSDAFAVPEICENAIGDVRVGARSQALLGLLDTVTKPVEVNNKFGEFMSTHKKSYQNEKEFQSRLQIWKKNYKFVENHNRNSEKHGYSLKLNHFSDLEHSEFSYIMLPNAHKQTARPRYNAHGVHPTPTAEELAALPTSVDWREKGAVTMVKDQGVCGSCWTFGTTGALEGAWAAKYGKLYELSEQQILDCSWNFGGESGCDGGFAGPALEWIMSNGGIASEKQYPYIMVDGYCSPLHKNPDVTVAGYVNVTMNDENALLHAVATIGPVAVAIDAAHEEFEYYSEGVYYNPNCKNGLDDLDHEVLVVGYGTENGQDYWIVKNSWSTYWGDKGYIKMARNRGNNCGIATQATYVLV